MTTPVDELDLPVLDLQGLDRMQALAAVANAGAQHWLARTTMGYALTDYPDVVAVLRDRRFHSALSLVPRMRAGAGPGRPAGRRPSILEMEGDEPDAVSDGSLHRHSPRCRPIGSGPPCAG